MLLRSNRELGQTTLMITHNPEAAAIASRILTMRDGEIIRVENGSRSAPAAWSTPETPSTV
jgi:putative ABC transport system ATP-binding protein